MLRIKIVHRTYYNFSSAVQLSPHSLMLRPRGSHEQRIESSSLSITPTATLRWQRDVHDNSVAIASFTEPTTQLAILSEVIVQHFNEAPLDFLVADHAVNYPFDYEPDELATLQPYLTSAVPAEAGTLRDWVGRFWKSGEAVQTFSLLQRLYVGIHETLKYQVREEPGVQSPAETLRLGSGSCRDFANLFMEGARSLGLAARFVSGYLNVPTTGDAGGATHAWAEVYLPGAGWRGFDPTIGEVVSTKHITVAVARLPESVPPVSGAYFGAPDSSMSVGVWVSEL